MKNIRIHPKAEEEIRWEKEYYRRKNPALVTRLREELSKAIHSISEAPNRYPIYMENCRRYLLFKFPFLVIYREIEDQIQIIAFAPGRKKPGYWKNRV
jgi:toxin ParE1/3/4